MSMTRLVERFRDIIGFLMFSNKKKKKRGDVRCYTSLHHQCSCTLKACVCNSFAGSVDPGVGNAVGALLVSPLGVSSSALWLL